MADIEGYNIEDLASLSALQLTDLLVGARGSASYKLLVSDIAKAIVENYKGSSLAGSAQSVKSALDSLNSRLGGIQYTTTSNFTDLDSVLSKVCIFEVTSATGAPNAGNHWIGMQWLNGSNRYGMRLAIGFDGKVYMQKKHNSESWSEWAS